MVYLFPDIMLLGEVRFLPTALDCLRLGHPIEGWGWGWAPMSVSQGTLSPLKAMAIPSMWHGGRD